ncbi:MAG TPA: M23 family metallopeptidase [Thermoanaerobaculia bacterium]|nr:M23 family metallopeptidase [Thermoanaerobaculia bacterium]
MKLALDGTKPASSRHRAPVAFGRSCPPCDRDAGARPRHAFRAAHLEAWVEGLREGMRVGPGQLIAFVGNSGNARSTATHLHFEVRERGRAVNRYYVLADATPVRQADERVASGGPSIWRRLFGR